MMFSNPLPHLRRALSVALSVGLLGVIGPALAHASDDDDDAKAKSKDEARAYDDEGKRVPRWNERDNDNDNDYDNDGSRVFSYKMDRADAKGGYLGVQVQDITRSLKKARDLSTDEGALVNRVEDESPADEAGIKRGDVIVQVSGESIEDSGDLVDAMRNTKPGSKVDVVVLRDGVRKTVKVEVAKRPRDMVMVAPGFRWRSNGMDADQMPGMMPGPEFRQEMEDLRKELDDLKRELRDLREELDDSRAQSRGRRSGS